MAKARRGRRRPANDRPPRSLAPLGVCHSARPYSAIVDPSEDMAVQLFEDPYFQWWNASQFALISRPSEAPPPIASRLPAGLFEEDWADSLAALQTSGVEMILRSGVDGDVCGIAFRSRAIRDDFETLLCTAARGLGLAVLPVSQSAFGQMLSESPDAPG